MANNSDNRKKKMIEALRKCRGIVSHAIELVGINRSTHYDWLKNDEDYKAEVESIDEKTIDFVESKLFELINGVTCSKVVGDEVVVYETPPCKTSCIFYLKTKAKHRGYTEQYVTKPANEGERSEIVLPNGTKITI